MVPSGQSRATGDPAPPPVMERLIGFGRFLRSSGLPVGTGRILSFCRAATVLDPFDPDDLRLAARSTLVSRPQDIRTLDSAFDRYFGRSLVEADSRPPEEVPSRDQRGEGVREPDDVAAGPSGWSAADTDDEVEGETAARLVASDIEVLRRKEFGELTEEERRQAATLIRRLALLLPMRASRRFRVAREGERFDLRGTLRRSLRTEGEPFRRSWKKRRTRRRPLVLILDVSGSMAPYTRPLLEFGHAATMAGRRVEVFCFGTRLTRITGALRARTPQQALDAAASAATDWEGGTRIGDSLKELLDVWSARSSLRGGVVVLCSDGLERGDPSFLAAQMARLSRLAYRVIWVNPLKGSPRFEPLARGMAASLPFVDVFLAGHNLESLEALAGAVGQA
jgi:uncharacterized protein